MKKLTKLRKLRRWQDLTQQQLAEKAGVSESVVFNAEHGLHSPRLEAVIALADALGVTVDELLEEEEAHKKELQEA